MKLLSSLSSRNIFLASTLLFVLWDAGLFAQASGIMRDDPLSDVDSGRSVYENLRGYIRDEIDQTMNQSQRTDPKSVNTGKLSNEIRKIVREEIMAAADIKQNKYLSPWTVEFGGFISMEAIFARENMGSNSGLENQVLLSLQPFVNVFLSRLVAMSGHFKCEYDIKNGSGRYNWGIGPMLATSLNKRDSVMFYLSLYAGMGVNNDIRPMYGFRYGNDVGLKFQLSHGSFLNVGLSIAMNTRNFNFSVFDTSVTPTIGISAWF